MPGAGGSFGKVGLNTLSRARKSPIVIQILAIMNSEQDPDEENEVNSWQTLSINQAYYNCTQNRCLGVSSLDRQGCRSGWIMVLV